MFKILKILFLLVAIYLVLWGTKVIAFAPEITWEEKFAQFTPQQKAQYFAVQYGANYAEMNKVIVCESNWRPLIYGDGGRAFSYAQFHKPTFDGWAKELGKNLSYENPDDHLELMAYAFSKGKSYKKHWTCAVKLGYVK